MNAILETRLELLKGEQDKIVFFNCGITMAVFKGSVKCQ